MLSIPVYLYPNIYPVILDLDSTVRGVNQVMYQRELIVQKGVKNKIQIQFKNSDQKRIHLNTGTYVFTMFDAIEQRQLITKQLNVIDDGVDVKLRGLAELTFTENDTVDLDVSSYAFSITYQDDDGSFLPAYSNTYYGINGIIHVSDDIYPALQPSQEITSFNRKFNTTTNLWERTSGNVYAYPEYNSNSALHTMAIYMTGFRGTVNIQGTLNNQPDATGYYATIETRTYNGFTGVDYVNFNGIYSYVRIQYIPASNPVDNNNDDPVYSGRLDKVLYRS